MLDSLAVVQQHCSGSSEENWEALDALIRAGSGNHDWHREVLRRAGIQGIVTDIVRRGDGQDDDIVKRKSGIGNFCVLVQGGPLCD